MPILDDLREWRIRRARPSLAGAVSQLCTQEQCDSREFAHWCELIRETPRYHRKLWEYCYILQVLDEADMLREGRTGVGFGVGREPLVAAMASRGCTVLASDMTETAAIEQGWATSGEHSHSLANLNERGICEPNIFRERVQFRVVDMNDLPSDIGDFDFIWSSCALEHLGSLECGLEFVRNSLKCLRPGGIAVHTTEFNLTSDDATVQDGKTVIYRRKDIVQFVRSLRRAGHKIKLNLNPGDGAVDNYVDMPPYAEVHHLKLSLSDYVVTSLGLKIRTKS